MSQSAYLLNTSENLIINFSCFFMGQVKVFNFFSYSLHFFFVLFYLQNLKIKNHVKKQFFYIFVFFLVLLYLFFTKSFLYFLALELFALLYIVYQLQIIQKLLRSCCKIFFQGTFASILILLVLLNFCCITKLRFVL